MHPNMSEDIQRLRICFKAKINLSFRFVFVRSFYVIVFLKFWVLKICVRGPFGVRARSARVPFGVRSGSVRGLRAVRAGSARDPFGVRSGSVRGAYGVRSGSVRDPKPPQPKENRNPAGVGGRAVAPPPNGQYGYYFRSQNFRNSFKR